jgi:hypothetical protein
MLVAKSTLDAYRCFLNEVKSLFEIGQFGPWDTRYVKQKLNSSLTHECLGALKLGDMEAITRGTFHGLGYEQEVKDLVFHGRPFDDLTLLANGLTHIFAWTDSAVEPFGETITGLYPTLLSKISLSGDGLESYQVLLHECGHLLHFRSVEAKYRILRFNMPVYFTGAVAKVVESLVETPEWLGEFGGISLASAIQIRKLRAMQRVLTLRENVVLGLLEFFSKNSRVLWPRRTSLFSGLHFSLRHCFLSRRMRLSICPMMTGSIVLFIIIELVGIRF